MPLLSSEKKHLFVDKLIRVRQQLDAFIPKNTLQSLELFENQLTLNEMEKCFFDSANEEINTNLIDLLSLRWKRICDSNMCYTQQPGNLVNELCLEIAKEIAPPASTASEIEALKPNTGPYCLLMPSLEKTEDVYGNNIHSLGLHEFVLSDNARVFIPLAQCLHQAYVSDEGQLRQTVAIDERYPELTSTEIKRVSNHSKQAGRFYQAVVTYNKKRLLGDDDDDIGAKLSQLVLALNNGGVHGGRSAGDEHNAGSAANLGIITFYNYWVALSEQKKLALFAEEPELKNILGRLFRPNDVDYKDVAFCVELIANQLDPIIKKYNARPTIYKLRQDVIEQEELFKTMTQNRHSLEIIQKEVSPKHILHHIFKLNIDEQKVIFKHLGYENALMYSLAHEPESLIEFQLDETTKEYAISVPVNEKNDSALIVAAKKGETDAIKLLLSWGAQIESHDLNKSTALHWAANNGHVDAVACLLEHGALLEARGHGKNSALNFAVMYGKRAVVELLLKKNAYLNVRNTSNGKNALGIAIAYHPELVEPILMHLAALPEAEQANCLLNVGGGSYPNVLFYAATNKPALFDTLVNILQQSNPHAVLNTTNDKGYNSLILAAQIGACESIRKLLALQQNIEYHDLNKSTALHWAANNGHVDAVACLLEHGAFLEARGDGSNSALNFAVDNGQSAVVEFLLKQNAQANVRSSRSGKNALDLALAEHPELIEPILMQLATLPVEEQAESLLNVPGEYDNIYAYVAVERPECFNRLLKQWNASAPAITNTLDKMQFAEHIKQISEHYQLMKNKSLSNSNYTEAALAAKILLIDCGKATSTLLQSDVATDIKILSFKNTCNHAIETAKPVLTKYREWGKVLAAFLLAIITFPVSLPLYALGLFSIKTKSEQLIDKLYEAGDKPNPS
ncbi:MAG: hypothetical protein BGO90_07740 [Legionella sp. 40-6]|nr:ankyrin repeat domain-containing protein [Legionella sp.]OJY01590.1 MAG: hypothetical protein BGO90_07740 [Legionella sp. 40-6]